MTGATAVMAAGIFSSAFHDGVLSAGTEEPMTQVPRLCAQAASIRFSAASQQSATTKGPGNFPYRTKRAGTVENIEIGMAQLTREMRFLCRLRSLRLVLRRLLDAIRQAVQQIPVLNHGKSPGLLVQGGGGVHGGIEQCPDGVRIDRL